jgi:hypothetical protein
LQYEVGLPDAAERVAILRRYLLRHEADMTVLRAAGQLKDGEGGVDLDLLLNRLCISCYLTCVMNGLTPDYT